MEKTEVYSWRLDPHLKGALEQAARANGTSLSRLLDRIAAEWLERNRRWRWRRGAEPGATKGDALRRIDPWQGPETRQS